MSTRVIRLLSSALEQRVFAGASLLVARRAEVVFEAHLGLARRVPTPQPLGPGMRFDVASLTKPLVTTTLAMLAVDRLGADLCEPLAAYLPVPERWAHLTPWHLLAHASGLPAWRPLHLELETARALGQVGGTRDAARAWMRARLLEEAPSYPPGRQSRYSDLGFMLLDWWLEARFAERLDRLFAREVADVLGLGESEFVDLDRDNGRGQDAYVATEACPWRHRVLQGEVHDHNTWAMGGVSGQAGLFTTARDVHRLLAALHAAWHGQRRTWVSPETVRRFWSPSGVAGSDFRLGWDGPAAQGYRSAGQGFSPRAVGHLGFTGCSIWLEPETGFWVVLLSNRIHPDASNNQIRAFRPRLHDCVLEQWGP